MTADRRVDRLCAHPQGSSRCKRCTPKLDLSAEVTASELLTRVCNVLDDGSAVLPGSAMHGLIREALGRVPTEADRTLRERLEALLRSKK